MRRILMLVGAIAFCAPVLRAQQLVATRPSLVHLLPAGDSRQIGAVRSGEPLLLLTQVNGFDRVLLPNQSVGWVDSTDVRSRAIAPAPPAIPPELRVAAALQPRLTPALPQVDATTHAGDAERAVASRASARDDSTMDDASLALIGYSLRTVRTPDASPDLGIVQQGEPEVSRFPVARNAALMFSEGRSGLQSVSFALPVPTRSRIWSRRRAPMLQLMFLEDAAPATRDASVHVDTTGGTASDTLSSAGADTVTVSPAARRGGAAYHAMSFAELLRLPWANLPHRRAEWSKAQRRQVAEHEGTPVSIDGYIVAWETDTPVRAGGEAAGTGWHDWRLWLVRTEAEASRRDRSHAIVVQLTQRTHGVDADRSEMTRIRSWAREGRRVHVDGPLLLDVDAPAQAGPRPVTAWEIAPAATIAPAP